MNLIMELFPSLAKDPEAAANYLAGLIVFAVFAAVFLIIYVGRKKERKRTLDLRRHAEERGLFFEEKMDIPGSFENIAFFLRGHGIEASNHTASIRAGNHRFDVFDYEYVTGSGKSRTLHRYACAYSHLKQTYNRDIPVFELVPENIFHRIADKFTHSDIDFEFYPHFSKLYRLTGISEENVRAFFKPAALSCLEYHPNLEIYSNGEDIVICRKGHLKSEEMFDFEDEVSEIIQVFAM